MSENIKASISKNIAKYRKQNGISQKELAEKIGAKNLTTVSSWERGISSPDAETIIQLCELFGVTLYDLYDIENKEMSLTYEEKEHIKKYRCLPDNGKEMVNMVLDNEYGRIDKNAPPLVYLPTTVAPTKEPAPEPQLSSDESLALSLYTQLDTNDKGEIKGEMKGMLKTEKYTAKKVLKNA